MTYFKPAPAETEKTCPHVVFSWLSLMVEERHKGLTRDRWLVDGGREGRGKEGLLGPLVSHFDGKKRRKTAGKCRRGREKAGKEACERF